MARPPLIALRNATFRRSPAAPPIFANTTFTLPSTSPPQKWAILGPSKSTFLSLLAGSLHTFPPNSRSYPLLSAHNKWPNTAIQHCSFGGKGGMLSGGTGGDGYISARYESLRERFDQTLEEWLSGSLETQLNPYEEASAERIAQEVEEERENQLLLKRVMRELRLEDLKEQAVMTLSNGQSRRARVAQALLKRPELLLVDEPFLGLDPPGKVLLSELLNRVSTETEHGGATPVVLGLRPQDAVPSWSTHIAYVEDNTIVSMGPKSAVATEVQQKANKTLYLEGDATAAPDQGVVEKAWSGISGLKSAPKPATTLAEPLVEMEKVKISYYSKVILDNFSWTIRRGERWGLFGPNGSGKTTLTSLLTSDHPLTYSQPIKHFSRTRLPTPGLPPVSVFAIQSRIGLSSPELHSFFPRHLTLQRCIESGFAATPLSTPTISAAERAHLNTVLSLFADLAPDGWSAQFGDSDMSTQRLALFLRATVTRRDLVVYDEAFSGMRREVRERCFAFLETPLGWEEDRQAMVVVSHVSEEVPGGVDRWVRLGEKGGVEGAVFGEF